MRRFTWPPAGKWPPDGLGSDGVDLKTLMAKRPTTPAGASESEASADVAGRNYPLFTRQLRARMAELEIPLTPESIVAGIDAAGESIDKGTATRHLNGEGKGQLNYRLRQAYAKWLNLPAETDLTRPLTDDAEADVLVDDAFGAAKRSPAEAHADLEVLLRSENGGLAKYVLRKLRQLTPAGTGRP